jgi:tetratricopeptide (TPR) repeat protein
LGQFPEAERAERQAVEIARQLVTGYPDVAAYKELEQWTYMMIAVNREKCGRFEEAESWYRQALAVTEALREKYPKVGRFQRIAMYGCWDLANVLWERGTRAEAAGFYARVRDAWSKAAQPDVLDTNAWFLAVCPDPQYRDPRRAIEIATRLVEQHPKDGSYWLTLGAARYRSGDYQAAIQALDTAEAVGMMPDFYATQHVWFFKAMAHGRAGERDRGRACYDMAVALANKKNHWMLESCRNCAEAEEVLGLPPRKK